MLQNILLNESNVIVAMIVIPNVDVESFPEGSNFITADIDFTRDMNGAIFVTGQKKPDDPNVYQSIEYIPRPPRGPEIWTVVNGAWVDGRDASIKMEHIKTLRNEQLLVSDWTQGNDSPLTTEKKTEWATWRTALRNLPQDYPEPAACQTALDALIGAKPS